MPDSLDVLPLVREYLSQHWECAVPDAYEIALVLRLPEAEVEYALQALAGEDGVLP